MQLKDSRAEIDVIDNEIVKLLKKRFNIAEEIGRAKKTLGIDVVDIDRDSEVLENYKKHAEAELNEEFLTELVKLILKYSKEAQK